MIIRALILALLCMSPISAETTDLTLINKLPQRVAEIKKECQKKWNSSNTHTMVEGSIEYDDKLVVILKELVRTYANKKFIKESDIDTYVQTLVTKIKFEQKLENPLGLDQGTLALHYLPNGLFVGLQNAIVLIVRGAVEYESSFNFDAWNKEWEQALNAGR